MGQWNRLPDPFVTEELHSFVNSTRHRVLSIHPRSTLTRTLLPAGRFESIPPRQENFHYLACLATYRTVYPFYLHSALCLQESHASAPLAGVPGTSAFFHLHSPSCLHSFVKHAPTGEHQLSIGSGEPPPLRISTGNRTTKIHFLYIFFENFSLFFFFRSFLFFLFGALLVIRTYLSEDGAALVSSMLTIVST